MKSLKSNDSKVLDMLPSARISALGIELPPAAQPSFKYIPVSIHGDLAFVSGQLPKIGGDVTVTGLVGDSVSIEEWREAALVCALQALACLAEALGSLDGIRQHVKRTGFVCECPGFHRQAAVFV